MQIEIKKLCSIQTKEEAQSYLNLLLESNPNNDIKIILSNIGYIAGYCSEVEFYKIIDLFDCEHPIFGKKLPDTPEEAFRLGMEFGEKMKDKNV